ncbi:hypothetical protein [Vibrio splendidus]|uniref:hypothetical protein n=1 Tax=Vibrio splendidus TaxID=29497 RepID=UPI00246867F3|nr:hypothetical protein [Vibrio splendidus]MDH5918171.1 hypothetical protein [Vibrio splendidus]
MDTVAVVKHLKELQKLAKSGFTATARYIEFEIPPEYEVATLELVCAIEGYTNELRFQIQKSKASFSKNGQLPLFSNFQELFNQYFPLCLKGDLGEQHQEFIVLDESSVPSDCDIFQQFDRIQDWILLCKDVIDNNHVEKSKKLNFYIAEELESEKMVKSRCLTISNSEVSKVFGKIIALPDEFKFAEDRSFMVEKRAVLKSTFLKSYKKSKDESVIVTEVMQNPSAFQRLFQSDYEFYTRKYSIDKVTREVEQAKIEYLDKINGIIHDNQAKALTIPVILFGTALVRDWGLQAILLLASAMVLALYFVNLSLEHKKRSVNDLEDSARNVLGRIEYEHIDETSYGKNSKLFEEAKEKVKNNAKHARDLLRNVQFGLFAGLLIWAAYIFCLYKSSLGS